MSDQFDSMALAVNLSETRQDAVALPEEHEYFLSLSDSYYGIHEYTRDLFFEYHHKYPNYAYIATRLRKMAVGDYWLYAKSESPERAFGTVLDLIMGQLEAPAPFDTKKNLVRTLVDFTERLLSDATVHHSILRRSLHSLSKLLRRDVSLVLLNSVAIKKQFARFSELPELAQQYYEFYTELCASNLHYWDSTTQIDEWLCEKGHYFSSPSLESLKSLGRDFFVKYFRLLEEKTDLPYLEENIPLYFDFSSFFREYVDELHTYQDRFHYLFYLLHVPGMNHQRDHLMYDLMVVLKNIFSDMDPDQAVPFLDDAFELFAELKATNTVPILACNRTLGVKVADLRDYSLCEYFAKKTIEFGFVRPHPEFHEDEWRLSVNPAHVANIRSWLEIFQHDPSNYRLLLAGLTANLKMGGVLIFDTDLFQKNVSKLLSADIRPVYKLVKQLCRILPIYFNEIGAEGELRDLSTRMDEITARQDLLVHYLRKQIHTESNNTHIELTRQIFRFWVYRDLDLIRDLVPRDVVESIELDGPFVREMNSLIQAVSEISGIEPECLIDEEEERLRIWIDSVDGCEESARTKLKSVCRIQHLLEEKYSFTTVDICAYLRKFRAPSSESIDRLERYLRDDETEDALTCVLEIMEDLNGIIFSAKVSEPWENIYYKRHIAYGIPSMYGTYHEEKFEALGKIFKLEQTASRLLGELEGAINLEYITVDSLWKIYRVLKHYQRGLQVDGISIKTLDRNLEMFKYSLRSRSFSIQQYVNMFRFIGESIRKIIQDYFFRPYDAILRIVIPQNFDCQDMAPKQLATFIHQKSEEFYRDMLSSAFLLQSLDAFISKIDAALHCMVDNYSSEMIRDIMTFEPDMATSPIYEATPKLDNQVFLGLKAYNLKKLYLLGYPVPAGFVISTEVFRRKDTLLNHPVLLRDIERTIRHQLRKLEELTGKELGNHDNPLMLSVRSGGAFSMPGAMNTFLNVGINEELTESLSRKENFGWTAWDCYRRFLQTWGMSNGLERPVFDKIMLDFEKVYNVKRMVDFTPSQMRDIVRSFREVIERNDIYIEDDPLEQLKATIVNVLDSWNSDLASTYRRILDIADEWGTAVLVQQMVLGNLNYTSGTGVLFTNADYSNVPGVNINGDYSSLTQGEDIVGGRVNPLTISADQPYSSAPETSLERVFPALYNKLQRISVEFIEEHGFNHQEIEFTFESQRPEDLFILQVRDQNITQIEDKSVFDAVIGDDELLGNGIGIGTGVLNGRIIFKKEDLDALRREDPDQQVILVRPDTVPDDIPLIFDCDGLITARGGGTSHAAVTAARLGKKCIVNTSGLVVDERKGECFFNGERFIAGDKVALDSNSGSIFKGNYPATHLM